MVLLLLSVISTGISLTRRCIYIAFGTQNASNRNQTRGPTASHSSLDLKLINICGSLGPALNILSYSNFLFHCLWYLPGSSFYYHFLILLWVHSSSSHCYKFHLHKFLNIWKDFRDYLIQPFNTWMNKIKAIETL